MCAAFPAKVEASADAYFIDQAAVAVWPCGAYHAGAGLTCLPRVNAGCSCRILTKVVKFLGGDSLTLTADKDVTKAWLLCSGKIPSGS